MITNRRVGKVIFLFSLVMRYVFFCLPLLTTVEAAEPLKKMRVAIPSIVIDFAPLWIAREKGIFREEGIDVELTFIQGNIRVVQALIAGEVQAGIAGSAGPISSRAAGEDTVIVAVPMNRLDYTFASRQPVAKPSDLNGIHTIALRIRAWEWRERGLRATFPCPKQRPRAATRCSSQVPV